MSTTIQDINDLTAIHDNKAAEINAITEKTTPVGNDLIIIEDSAASNAKKKVKISNLPGGAGGKNDISFSYATTAGDYTEIASTGSYTMIDSFIFRGSDALGTPSIVKALVSSTVADQHQWRIYDKTNSLQICEGNATDFSTKTIADLGSLSNISTGIAIWELQIKEVPSSNGKARIHGLLIGF